MLFRSSAVAATLPGSDVKYIDLNGPVTIVAEKPHDEFDYAEVGPMFTVTNGTHTFDVFADELVVE